MSSEKPNFNFTALFRGEEVNVKALMCGAEPDVGIPSPWADWIEVEGIPTDSLTDEEYEVLCDRATDLYQQPPDY